MARKVFQIRPKDANPNVRNPLYALNRDLAYVGPGMCSTALASLDEQWQEPWVRKFIADNHIVQADLEAATLKLAGMLNLIRKCKDPVEAAATSGFDQLPQALQVAIYCRIGQVALGGVWAGILDVSEAGCGEPPMAWQTLRERLEIFFTKRE